MKIGIVTSTVKDGRKSLPVAKWVLEHATKQKPEVNYELVDLKDFELPMLGMAKTEKELENVASWKNKINELDGFIFVTAEYNYSPSGVFKNALDYLNPELNNKVVSFVGYGGLGGARSIEQLRSALAPVQVATTQRAVNLLLTYDFVDFSEFKPKEYQIPALDELLEQNFNWTKALKTIR